jgi:hypothetical protein
MRFQMPRADSVLATVPAASCCFDCVAVRLEGRRARAVMMPLLAGAIGARSERSAAGTESVARLELEWADCCKQVVWRMGL